MNDYDLRLALAHEVMHCFQVDLVGDLSQYYKAPSWIIEGEASWVGFFYADQISGASQNYTGFWGEWLLDASVPLFKRSYDAIGYYALYAPLSQSRWLESRAS